MRRYRIFALINALAAAVLLIVLSMTADIGGFKVAPRAVVEATKSVDPETGLRLLANGLEGLEDRAQILKWLCYGALLLLAINSAYWAAAAQLSSREQNS